MIKAYHFSEAFVDSGSTYGTSAKKALGRPNLERWELFTRETLQNSWDARDRTSNEDGVSFCIEFDVLDDINSERLKNYFDAGLQGVEGTLGKLLLEKRIPLLVVSDTGTSGLQGPTSAANHFEGRDDFVSFVRNIGRSSEKQIGGGTYGFGKGVFFEASRVSTVLVYTRTHDEFGNPVSRFIAMSNAESYASGGRNYTGRHWWGQRAQGVDNNYFANPFTGEEADALAGSFKMDTYFSEEQPTGTSIAVLDPAFEDSELSLESIANSLTKWAWPHMIANHTDMDDISFSVKHLGQVVQIPDPHSDRGLRPFISAYKDVLASSEPMIHQIDDQWRKSSGRNRIIDVKSANPLEYLGKLCISKFNVEPPESEIVGKTLDHQIALLRNPRMVVDYWEGPKDASGPGYCGVFTCAQDLDPIFAASEPPAHDEWNPKSVDLSDARYLSKTGKVRRSNPVNIALNRMREKLKSSTPSKVVVGKSEVNPAVSGLADHLGSLVTGAAGTSTSVIKPILPKPKPPTLTTPSKGFSVQTELVDLEESTTGPIAIFRIVLRISQQVQAQGLRLQVQPLSIIEGKTVSSEIDGIPLPKLLGWIDSASLFSEWDDLAQNDLTVEETTRDIFNEAVFEADFGVLQPPNTAVSIKPITELIEAQTEEF